ncbi:type II and III secretion system protein family protein [Gluconacetobacter sp. 1b LMG 1731]|uniref:Type II and III secretion system protein family protein n=1 Tax=Gluconacetobacter dulcium TaxID=2729096 RepID=A0A7W4NRP2_9PROT|nr:type II and III secretion system protein family protein [Gluconacetobacter dulcium]MBB2163692.1 type II and III secretion system protein family protein [Gluconacetobacter dulcium]MBB2192894.1 type II and III secretion system protein family protein [Gluconacetobacter dulcium]
MAGSGRAARLVMVATLSVLPALNVRAQEPGSGEQAEGMQALSLEVGSGHMEYLPEPAARIFVVDPRIVQVRPASGTSMVLYGVAAGRTTVMASDAAGRTIARFTVDVLPSRYGASQAEAEIARQMPGSQVRVQADLRNLVLTGSVESPEDASRAEEIAKGFVAGNQGVTDRIAIRSATQVTLVVRIAEMDRNVVRQLGIDWQAVGNMGKFGSFPALTLNMNASTAACVATRNPFCLGSNVNGVVDALAQDNLVRLLAEPNLTVMSGQSASFQVGGQYPIPLAQQAGAISVAFKSYGVSLTFLPTVFSNGRINLHVVPEVSQLSNQNSVSVTTSGSTSVIPALTVRRAETTVELGSGETFAIAGLLEDSLTDSTRAIPGAGDIPVLGTLFRSGNFNRQETELVILVTPYLVRPVADRARMTAPTDMAGVPGELDRLLLLRQAMPTQPARPVAVPGSAGFFVE